MEESLTKSIKHLGQPSCALTTRSALEEEVRRENKRGGNRRNRVRERGERMELVEGGGKNMTISPPHHSLFS